MRDAAIALDGQAGSVERRTAASRLSLLGEDPHWRVSAPSCADPVLRWAVSLLLAIRTYRPNTVRTWLMRLARIGDTGRLDQLVGAGVTEDRTLVTRAILASCRSVETMLATRTALRQFIRFATHMVGPWPRSTGGWHPSA